MALFDHGLRGYLGYSIGKLTPSSIRGIRVIRGSILPLLAVVCFLQSPNSTKAQALVNAPAVASIDGIDCVTSYDADEEALVVDNSSGLPNDLDEISLPAGAKAVIPSRNDHVFSSFTLHTSSFFLTPSLSFLRLGQPVRSPYNSSLHEHIRERAPPSLA